MKIICSVAYSWRKMHCQLKFGSKLTIVSLLCLTMALCTIWSLDINGNKIIHMTTSVLRRLTISLYIMFTFIAFFKITLVAFYSHVENTCMTASFQNETRTGPIKLATFYWNACTNPGKWAVVYLCWEYRIYLFLRFWYLILELFRKCFIFCFSFYNC